MAARVAAWMVGALLAASVVFWVLRLGGAGEPRPSQARSVALEQAARGDVLRLLGARAPAQPAEATEAAAGRFRVLGVIAPAWQGPTAGGVALISVDGLPARAVRVGERLAADLDWVLQRVSARRVELGVPGGPVALGLDLPGLPPAATGELPATAVAGSPAVATPPVRGLPAAPPVVDLPEAIQVPPPPPPEAR